MRRWTLILAAIAACLALGWWIHLYLVSPHRVAVLAASAIERHDPAALVSLAGGTELAKLHITTRTVETCLRSTVWRGSSGIAANVARSRPYYGDVLVYATELRGSAVAGGRHTSEIWVYRDAGGRWRLALSMLLNALFQAARGPDSDRNEWHAIELDAGMVATTIPGGPTTYAADGHIANDIDLIGAGR